MARSEAPDLAVDELKRRARRRLVGAIVLALAAAVLLPLLLESEPKPLGDEVSIRIPPIDSGKFINPLSPDKSAPPTAKSTGASRSAAPTEKEPAVIQAPKPDSGGNEPAPAGGPIAATPTKNAAIATTSPEAAATADAKRATPEPALSAAAPTMAEAKPEPIPAATKDDAKAEPPGKDANAFVVQVAAFTDRYGALALVRKLKEAGFPGFTEPATTDKGALHRVRVGPYASRDAAEAARVKLKAAGYDAIVARVQ